MARALVIGFGSSLRGDDALGIRVVEGLRNQVDPALVEILTLHQLGPELAETISRYPLVILVDASIEGAAGTVRSRHIVPDRARRTTTHAVDPAALLSLSESLYGKAPTTLLVTVTGEEFGFGTDISDTVETAIPRALAEIQYLLDANLGEAPPGEQ